MTILGGPYWNDDGVVTSEIWQTERGAPTSPADRRTVGVLYHIGDSVPDTMIDPFMSNYNRPREMDPYPQSPAEIYGS